MRKFPFIVILTIFFMLPSVAAFGIQYCKDVLESGNPGGWNHSHQTYEDEVPLGVGECVYMDIWVNDLPEPLLTAGFFMTYDPSLSGISIEVYDGPSGPDGPWDPGASPIVPDAGGPGTYLVAVLQLSTVPPGPGGDIIIARVRICGNAAGDNSITISTIPDFLTVVGSSQTVYDAGITPNTVIIHQFTPPCVCTISPSLFIIEASAFMPVTQQFTVSENAQCQNPPTYVWSDTCALGSVDQNGLFTVPPTTLRETCQICVADIANTNIYTGEPATCCADLEIYGDI